MRAIVVGAGLAGLSCALRLTQANWEVTLYEASDRVGGRCGSLTTADGFVLDRGFQVIFTQYPTLQQLVPLSTLKPVTIDSGAIIRLDGRSYTLSNPIMRPQDFFATLQVPFVSFTDKWKIARMTLDLISTPSERILASDDARDIQTFLADEGFSRGFIDHFIRPFFGGIFLARDLTADCRIFKFYWKVLASGMVVLPREGMQALPDQLASRLGKAVHLKSPVARVVRAHGRATGVVLEGGETCHADAVILAADPPANARLAETPLCFVGKPVTTLYFASPRPLSSQRKVILNGELAPWIHLVCDLSTVNPHYAPKGRSLITAQLLGEQDADDERLAARCKQELAGWFPDRGVDAWRTLEVLRVPFGGFRQEPAVMAHLPSPRLETGLYQASEVLFQSSFEGALRGGAQAADAVLADHPGP